MDQLRDDSLETYWQSDGPQPHLVNIQFRKKTAVRERPARVMKHGFRRRVVYCDALSLTFILGPRCLYIRWLQARRVVYAKQNLDTSRWKYKGCSNEQMRKLVWCSLMFTAKSSHQNPFSPRCQAIILTICKKSKPSISKSQLAGRSFLSSPPSTPPTHPLPNRWGGCFWL